MGYRVRSVQGVQFRRWATERLREYLVKGFTMDDERSRMDHRLPVMGLTNYRGKDVRKANERDVLSDAGKVSHEAARRHAQSEYHTYAAERRALPETDEAEASVKALEAAEKVIEKKTRPGQRKAR